MNARELVLDALSRGAATIEEIAYDAFIPIPIEATEGDVKDAIAAAETILNELLAEGMLEALRKCPGGKLVHFLKS